ncbi:glycoside hydrolase family 3 C-terminal domain-containing protein [Mycetocola reblochoni]|uniref:Exo-alpha-(1->6)-L-arabinopyranosidase n=2 Tax=Mycetocola reblochoni TaxID=331618 RepID=A0A1R4J2F9_9MICO|nr:glycoside hydrolase family 3 C-terminal domain-containing protein [Mycetocola reblochoni]RLP71226.1 beta-glucosidase [Mycetocola reblochoni]SJN25935.1 Beta-glucosidase [Mycetocola reblochoni REB411]
MTTPRPSLEQKAALTSGRDTWHSESLDDIPVMMMTDGPHGLRQQLQDGGDALGIGNSVPATCFPPAAGLASSWNTGLVERVGVALGTEARATEIRILLGPGLNIKRSPLGGRNFEYFSEDPRVSGELAAAMVTGIQSMGVAATPKHFAVNNQETDRLRVSAEVDERALREIYLSAFERVVTVASPWAFMSSYNRINGVYASENHWLLTELLREEWGFDGLVMSDWGAVNDRVAALAAGLELEMPPTGTDQLIVDAVRTGELDEAVLDRAVDRLRLLAERTERPPLTGYDADAHDDLARSAAQESIVLLKNADVLPLDAAATPRIAVVGEFARTPRYQGGGSSRVVPTRMHSALDALTDALGLGADGLSFSPGFALDGDTPAGAADEAVAAVEAADVAVLFLGLPDGTESEGFDRTTIALPAEQLHLLERAAATTTPVVVVLSNGAVVDVASWEHHADAILEAWLLGQAGGLAIADVLLGTVSPSGKLAETIPLDLADTPSHLSFPGRDGVVVYGESVYVGYRHYDTRRLPVAYPFGFGLSYTRFEYSELEVTATGRNSWTVAATVTNVGERRGAETVQLYIGVEQDRPDRPVHELRGFAKVDLEPGESARVELPVTERDLSHWSVRDGAWRVEKGRYTVELAAHSRDVRLATTITSEGDGVVTRLNGMSTVGEWLDHPYGREQIQWFIDGVDTRFGATAPEMIVMLKQLPIAKLTTFGIGLDSARIERMCAEAAADGERHGEQP